MSLTVTLPKRFITFLNLGIPLLSLATIITIMFTSQVTSVSIYPAHMIETVAVAYGLLLAALTIRHDRWLHFLGMLLGGFFFTSRGLAFLQIASAGRPDLMGAVAERALLTIVVISYHYLMLYVLTRKKA